MTSANGSRAEMETRTADLCDAHDDVLVVEPIHDRMPVLLPRELEGDWLDLDNQDTGLLREILLPYDPGLMTAYEVSTRVNAVKNQGRELILQRPLS